MNTKYYISKNRVERFCVSGCLTEPVYVILHLEDGVFLDSEDKETSFDLELEDPVEITSQQYVHLYWIETKLNNTILSEIEKCNPDICTLSMMNAEYQAELLAVLNNGPSDRYYLSARYYRCRDEDYNTIFNGDYMLIHKHIDFHSVTFYDWSDQKRDIGTESFDKDVSDGCLRAITEKQFKHLATIRGLIKRVYPITVAADPALTNRCSTQDAKTSLKSLAELAKQQMTILENMYSQECAAILNLQAKSETEETNLFSSTEMC